MTNGLRPYPEYKDAGSRWLDPIPAHWDIRAAKRLFAESVERARPDDIQLSATQSHGVIPQAEFERLVGRKVVRILNHLDKRKHVEKDDFVISMRSFQGGLERAWARGAIRSSYVVLKPRRDVHVPYFAHLFKSNPYIQALRATCQFIRDGQDLTFANFCQVPLPVVPVNEQRAIADFLDASATRIRRFIRNRRRLIEVLNEQKQAIINRAVTRGLDESAPLKPSGIDWLGDIPAHWHTKRLKYLANNINSQTTTKQPDEVYIALEHVESWTGRVRPPANDVQFDSQVKRFQTGDVLFGKLRPYLAKVTRAESAGVCVGEFLVLRTADDSILPEFLEAKLRSKRVIDLINSSTFGAKMPRADWRFIGNLVIAYPPTHAEQRNILTETEAATSLLQVAIDRAASEIELVQEYRTRLIADVVTGKLDVRGFVPSEPVLADGSADEPIEDVGLEDEEAELVEEAVDAAD